MRLSARENSKEAHPQQEPLQHRESHKVDCGGEQRRAIAEDGHDAPDACAPYSDGERDFRPGECPVRILAMLRRNSQIATMMSSQQRKIGKAA